MTYEILDFQGHKYEEVDYFTLIADVHLDLNEIFFKVNYIRKSN